MFLRVDLTRSKNEQSLEALQKKKLLISRKFGALGGKLL